MGSTKKVQVKGIIAMASIRELTDQNMKEIMRNLLRKVRISVPQTASANITETIRSETNSFFRESTQIYDHLIINEFKVNA